MRSTHSETSDSSKGGVVLLVIVFLFVLIIIRLFYWQVVKGSTLREATTKQSQRTVVVSGNRGQIFTSDKHLLVGNTPFYEVIAELEELPPEKLDLAKSLAEIVGTKRYDYHIADSSKEKETIIANLSEKIQKKMERESGWVTLIKKVDLNTKQEIEEKIPTKALSFQQFQGRFYPEASMAAHLTGFVGKNDKGNDLGYFGIEGALNKELSPQTKKRLFNTDAFGFLLSGQEYETNAPNGRDVVLTIRRDIQFAAENHLKKGIENYGAKSGEIIIMDPKTGKILALASWPHYEPYNYSFFNTADFKNPSISASYEPGSTFKVLTIAAGIDSGAITPDTECTRCAGPRKIDKYTIKTWDDNYYPNINMTDALAKSDNTAMIFVAESTGKDTFVKYLKKFAIGEELNIDLQDDTSTPFPKKWGPVELATTSFGQGISTTSMQLVRAIGAIANNGEMMRPLIVDTVIDQNTGKEIEVEPTVEERVISPESAKTVTEMMIASAHHGEAQWTAAKKYTVAGKTGTSQVATKGGYEENKTIASFIGFSPAHDPKFIMLVKLNEPSSSPWAAETAAPLWYNVAEKLFLLMNIPEN